MAPLRSPRNHSARPWPSRASARSSPASASAYRTRAAAHSPRPIAAAARASVSSVVATVAKSYGRRTARSPGSRKQRAARHTMARHELEMAPEWCHSGAMNQRPYVDDLRHQLVVAADAGGDDARAVAERLVAPLEAGVRLALQDVLAAAADEITTELAPGSVELRLRGREPEFVVTPPPVDEADD